MFKNTKLMILILVMLVNSLSYGTIIPLLYPYAARFGIDPLGLGWLFASFSLAQFIATPIIGRLSDKYGRKPLLLLCLLGTGLSQALFASATTIPLLFIARILDGVTGGNNSVAQAIVADTTTGEERAKAFGLLGASFGAGFLIGPAIGGLLSQISLTAPFWFSAVIATVGTIIGYIYLPETLPKTSQKEVKQEQTFNISAMVKAMTAPVVGLVLLTTFLVSLALNVFILGFQSFTVDVLKLSTTQIGLLFAAFGLVSMLMQAVGIKYLLEWLKSKKTVLLYSVALCAIVMVGLSLTNTLWTFATVLVFHMIANGPQFPMLSALLTERTREEDQGGVLGINQSYLSLGQIIGPILGGLVAARSVPMVFLVAGGLYGLSIIATLGLFRPVKAQDKADI